MELVRSLYVWLASAFLTIFVFLVQMTLLPFVLILDPDRKLFHLQCTWWAIQITRLNPKWKVIVSGREHLDPARAYVIVANHQSLADIIVLFHLRTQFKWVAKETLFNVPALGWCMSLAKYIRLTRGEFGSIKKVYREAAEWLRKGFSVAFFPEGTRSSTGQINDFKSGAFKLAIKEKKSILPILIQGTDEVVPKGSWFFKEKVTVKITILPPIDSTQFLPSEFNRLSQVTREVLDSRSTDAKPIN